MVKKDREELMEVREWIRIMLLVDEGCASRIVHMRLTLLDETVLAKDKGERERERVVERRQARQ